MGQKDADWPEEIHTGVGLHERQRRREGQGFRNFRHHHGDLRNRQILVLP